MPLTLAGSSARLALYCMARKFGMAMAARMPTIATTIISSSRLKPRLEDMVVRGGQRGLEVARGGVHDVVAVAVHVRRGGGGEVALGGGVHGVGRTHGRVGAPPQSEPRGFGRVPGALHAGGASR